MSDLRERARRIDRFIGATPLTALAYREDGSLGIASSKAATDALEEDEWNRRVFVANIYDSKSGAIREVAADALPRRAGGN